MVYGGVPSLDVGLTVCLIVRNEATRLPRCLASVRAVADEIIVVDTGSQDETVAVAAGLGARVAFFPWSDDFAAARNAALDLATGRWVLHLDADEVLETGHEALRDLAQVLSGSPVIGALWLYDLGDGPRVWAQLARLHSRHPALRWSGRIHEQLVMVPGSGPKPPLTPIEAVIRHEGGRGPEGGKRRSERNCRLLTNALTEKPDDSHLHAQMGLQRLDEAPALAARHLRQAFSGLGKPAVWPAYAAAALQGWLAAESALGHWEVVRDVSEGHGDLMAIAPACRYYQALAALQAGNLANAIELAAAGWAAMAVGREGHYHDGRAQWRLALLLADLAARAGALDMAMAWLLRAHALHALAPVMPGMAAWFAIRGRPDLAVTLLSAPGAGAAEGAGALRQALESGRWEPQALAGLASPPTVVEAVSPVPRVQVILRADGGDAVSLAARLDDLSQAYQVVVVMDRERPEMAATVASRAGQAVVLAGVGPWPLITWEPGSDGYWLWLGENERLDEPWEVVVDRLRQRQHPVASGR